MGKLPGFHRAKRDWQSGGFAKCTLVVLINLGAGQNFRQILVRIHRSFFRFPSVSELVLVKTIYGKLLARTIGAGPKPIRWDRRMESRGKPYMAYSCPLRDRIDSYRVSGMKAVRL